MIRKLDLYNKAINLRQKGLSYNEIIESIPVAQSTVSRWCQSIILTSEQIKRLNDKRDNNPFIAKVKEQSLKTQKEAELWADEQMKAFVALLHNRNKLLLISGILLYWAEGSKFKHTLAFTNTDGDMIKLIMEFFRKILLVPENKFKLMVRIGNKGDVAAAKEYWLNITKIPITGLRKEEILELNKNSKSLEKYPYGMCRVEINDTALTKKLIALLNKFIKNTSPRRSMDRTELS